MSCGEIAIPLNVLSLRRAVARVARLGQISRPIWQPALQLGCSLGPLPRLQLLYQPSLHLRLPSPGPETFTVHRDAAYGAFEK